MLVPVERTSFAAGQIDTAARHDVRSPLYAAGCQIARNHRILTGGGMKRRPGLRLAIDLTTNGAARGCEMVDANGNSFKLMFSNGRVDIYDVSNAYVATLLGPWTAAQLDQLYISPSGPGTPATMIVSHQAFWPKVITYDGTTWAQANFAFDTAFSGGPAQPYYRYAPKLVTMQPSALTGSITLSFSASVMLAGHVGAYVRYLGNAILITAQSGNSATGTVQGALPQTVTFTVDNASNFAVGEQAEGLDSGSKGEITNISGGTLTFVYESNYGGLKSGETLVGDSSKAQAKLTSNPSNTTPAAVVDWDEQAFSGARGYPGGAATHRGRLYFFNLRDLPRGVAASAAGLPNYFLVGANDGDAFFELAPDYKGQRVLHVVTADQGLVLTDQAVYYLPEVNAPVTPNTIDFKFVAPVGCSAIRPIPTEQGFAFIEAGANRAIGVLPTGSITQPWRVEEISAFWSELLTGPVSMGGNYQTAGFPERYGFVVNADGTAACVKYQAPDAPVPIGWTAWSTANGKFHSIFTAAGSLFAVVERTSPAKWTLEQFTDARFLDCMNYFTDPTAALTFYENTTVAVMNNASPQWYQGSYAVNGSGILQGCSLPVGQYWCGYDISTELKPTSPAPVAAYGYGPFRFGMNIGIPRMYLHVVNTTAYTISGQVFGGSVAQGSAPALVTGAKRWKLPGRKADLAPDITQQIPGPIEVIAMTMEVSF